ncbi:hypothetical protein Dsin_017010 [Dipteronia sinensis]|uniref:DDE Tnp4 domain-containing protein n=1 Tax=Dipteronia sinensis TaxID=43782 RepID=A0AAE0AEA2_9ROSI|nr:hypothetical protein Dsin_017010 [Dipteronia sinensis]
MKIGDSQNGNDKGKGKTNTYQQWTMDDSNLLLGLLAEAMKNGLCDANGSLSKLNVENFILPRLNAKTRFPKIYSNYLSRMKWLKNQYNKINELMRNNSSFGWDPIGNKVTASDEVWEEYLKSHSSHKKLRTKCSVDYDDLQLVVGVGTTTGNDSKALGADDIDPSILGNEENTISRTKKFPYDATNNAFIAPQNNTFDEMYRGNNLDDEEMNDDEMSEDEVTEIDEEFYEAIKILVMAVQVVIHVVNELRVIEAGQNHRYCVIYNNFRRSQFVTSENFHKMLKALNTLSKDMISKPELDCIGAIDGTHIPATVMGHDNSSFRDRHGNISQNVLAACNFDLEFMYVLAGRNELKVPKGKYFLADCGFANRRQILAPYRGVRYHLQDFIGNGNDPENEKELFNLRHASLRNVIERIFGIFESRFTIFKLVPSFPFKTQVEIILTCVALHNFLCKECRSDEFPIEEESASSSSLIVEEELDELVS